MVKPAYSGTWSNGSDCSELLQDVGVPQQNRFDPPRLVLRLMSSNGLATASCLPTGNPQHRSQGT